MKHRKMVFLVVALLCIRMDIFSQSGHLTNKDIKRVVGCWEGTLTYLDYSSNKPFSMPANLNVSQIGKSDSFSFANLYPEEPNANSVDTVTISPNGKAMNKEVVKSKHTLKDGSLEIVTELLGEDGNDNKKATFRFTYIIGPHVYEHKKEVQFVGTSTWILRHEYKYKRKSCG